VSADAILTAAAQLLGERGVARMSTNRIAARAGVNVALVYRYFAGKEAIVAALIERLTQATRERFEAALAAHAAAPLDVLIRVSLETLTVTPSDARLHRELFEHIDISKQRGHIRAQSASMTEAAFKLLSERRSELRPLPDAAAMLFVLEHAIFSATHAAVFYRPPELSQARAVDALADMVCRALLP